MSMYGSEFQILMTLLKKKCLVTFRRGTALQLYTHCRTSHINGNAHDMDSIGNLHVKWCVAVKTAPTHGGSYIPLYYVGLDKTFGYSGSY